MNNISTSNPVIKVEEIERPVWQIASEFFPTMEQLKRFGLHCLMLSFMMFISGISLQGFLIDEFPTMALTSMAFITFPFCVALPLGAKLLRCTRVKLLHTVVWPLAACIAVYLIAIPTDRRSLEPFIRDSVPEELIKFFCCLIPLWSGTISDSYALVFSAFVSGFTFGVIENIIYVASYTRGGAEFEISLLRFLLGPLLHASWTMFAAILVSVFRTVHKGAITWWEIVAYPFVLVVPILLHGFTNMLLISYTSCVDINKGNFSYYNGTYASGYYSLYHCAGYGQGALALEILTLALPFLMMIPLRRQRETVLPHVVVV